MVFTACTVHVHNEAGEQITLSPERLSKLRAVAADPGSPEESLRAGQKLRELLGHRALYLGFRTITKGKGHQRSVLPRYGAVASLVHP